MKIKRSIVLICVLCLCLSVCITTAMAAATTHSYPKDPVVTTVSGSNVASSGKPQLTWSAVEGAAQYYVYGRNGTATNGTFPLLATVTGTTWVHESAEPTATYTYFVEAVDANETLLGCSNTLSVSCVYAQPSFSLRTDPVTGKIIVSWEPVEGNPSTYRVYYLWDFLIYQTVSADKYGYEWVINAGEPGWPVSVSVQAAGGSKYSSAIPTYKYMYVDCPQPVITLSSNASTGKTVIRWDKVEGASYYRVYASDGSGYKLLGNVVNGCVGTHYSGEPGVTYYYKVQAVNGQTSASNSALSAAKYKVCDLAQPVLVSAGTNSSGHPRLQWKPVDGAVAYKVYYSTSADSGYTLLGTVRNGCVGTHSSAVAGTTYYYKVIAVAKNTAANSAFSSVVSVTAE